MIQITPEQAYQHGYQDGLHAIPACRHAGDPNEDIALAYGKGRWDGIAHRMFQEMLDEMLEEING